MNIDKLKEVIQKANPEIIALKENCIIQLRKDVTPHIFEELGRFMSGKIVYDRIIYGNIGLNGDFTVREWKHMEVNIVRAHPEWFKILGRPITLSDVLLADIAFIDEETLPGNHRKELYTNHSLLILSKWDLKKDFDGQSDEFKQFLYDLLVGGRE